MPKKYGVKEKDLVVSHILNLVLTGKLRTGDRVDRNEIAQGPGVSRVPIQEALVQLEHDGIVSTRYHRGAFVERFDEATVLEHHELDGLLNGIASARAAANPTPRILGQLDAHMRSLRASKDSRTFSEVAWEYRRTVNERVRGAAAACGDPRLTKPYPARVLGDLPEQPRRDAAVLRGRDHRHPPA
jgi:DNA-binding GntR family transcriptional regulator